MVSVIQKLSPYFSLAKWLLCSTGLIRYLHPTDTELKILAGVPKDKQKPKKDSRFKNNDYEKSNSFHVPRNLAIQLESAKVGPMDVIHLRYYAEYQWLVDFSLYAAIVYICSEVRSYFFCYFVLRFFFYLQVYHFFFPLIDELNLSMMWCLLVILFALYPFSRKKLTNLFYSRFKGNKMDMFHWVNAVFSHFCSSWRFFIICSTSREQLQKIWFS